MTLSEAVVTTAVYFTRPSNECTEDTFRLAKKRAEELGIGTILVATTRGETAVKAAELLAGLQIVVVTHSTGFKEPNAQDLQPEHRAVLEAKGVVIFTGTHVLGGVGRAVRRRFGTYQTEEIIAHSLKILGQGIKVSCEIAMMAADAGLVRTDQEVIAVAGTQRGADTAVVLQPAHAQDFFKLRIKEIICKPRL